MVLTKPELLDILASSCESTFVPHMLLYTKMVDILDWYDDEPRDIRQVDLQELELQLAIDLDKVLSKLENACQ
jgi:hypothetical protein